MKSAIIYDSLTGNTEQLAKAIKKEINSTYYQKVTGINELDADIYYVGTPVIKGTCTEKIKKFLETLENKKIFLFVTAGYDGSEEYYDKLKSRILANIPKSNTVIGTFFCQGKMPNTVKERYIKLIKENPEDQNLKVSLDNFEDAKTHPNNEDLTNLINTIKKSV